MVTALYAAFLSLLIIYLTVQVIKQRRANLVSYADGGVEELQIARSAHSNAVEMIPITLIMMGFAEFNGTPLWLIHIVGVAFCIGRVMHAKAVLAQTFKLRKIGMILSFLCLIVLAVANVVYLPWSNFW
ncbi:MAPEG family protein [Vibrio maerlii]|uniref:MAPEG family protein n=1 Tax=Vibrio maerlii TaxID=2231648 RepID=UPI000E3E547C|nr:MAPEG family protein [Vibrio maerlii]